MDNQAQNKSYYATEEMTGHVSNLPEKLIKYDEVTEAVLIAFGGYQKVRDEKNREVLIKPEGAKPLMNDEGLDWSKTFLAVYQTKVFSTTKLSDDMIRKMALEKTFDVIDVMKVKYKDFGIDKNNVNFVVDVFDNIILAMLNKSIDGFTVEKITTSLRTVERQDTKKEKRNLFSRKRD